MTIQELYQRKGELAQQAQQVLDAANGEMRAEDSTKFDAIHDDIEKLNKEIDRRQRQEAVLASLDESAGRRADPTPPSTEARRAPGTGAGPLRKSSNQDRLHALAGWLLATRNDEHRSMRREAAHRLGVNPDQNEIRIRLADVAPKSLRADDWREWESRYIGVDIVSPDGGGHYTVPDETMRALERALLAFGGMRQVATVIRTSTGADLPIPTTNDTGNEGAILGEGLEHTELDVEFSQLVLQAYKYTSRRVGVSVEYLQDNAINAAQVIGEMLGERIARITNRHFTVGNGSGQPLGIVAAAASSGVTTAAAGSVTYDNLVDLVHSVDPAYRELGGRFMLPDAVLKVLKKIKVSQFSGDTSGYPLWKAGMAAGDPDTIDGYPYTINQHMAAPTAGQKSIIFGALSKYIIRDVRDITLRRLDERYAELGLVAFLAFSRHDGDLLNAGTNPVKYLTMGS